MCATMTASRNDWWRQSGNRGQVQISGSFSTESEHDLALMVRDFHENGGGVAAGSSGADSWCSSDSDSGLPDLPVLADKILRYKHSLAPFEKELCLTAYSLMISMKDFDLHSISSGQCGVSCVRFTLAKMLRDSGYDAAVCAARWQSSGKVPRGDHEYIDVIKISETGTERVIIDIDFRSHFEIARAVHAYDRILKSLPVVFVGSLSRLKLYLQVMAEAAKSSLRQNSMPIPPWRSLSYLQAKWNSPFQRLTASLEHNRIVTINSEHKRCSGFLKRLQFSLHDATDEERCLKPRVSEKNRRSEFY